MTQSANPSLYQRLGGYDAIAAVVDDFFARMMQDPQLNRFFIGHSHDSKRRIRQLTVDMISEATGGPSFYTGRTMKVSHEGLGITENDWDLSVRYLKETLAKFQVPAREQEEVLSFIGRLKEGIVEKTGK
uniref:Group 1 truncated hemoglobin n=1 Tax=Desulfobacca acetoxidans TaxID=60893 RepID=A0A7C5AKX4_9BACT